MHSACQQYKSTYSLLTYVAEDKQKHFWFINMHLPVSFKQGQTDMTKSV